MNKKLVYPLAGLMLAFMLVIAFFSLRGDSAIMDEVAHLPAGYSYIVEQDMRLNPEHPPLVKDLAGGAAWLWSKIAGEKINFPYQLRAWQTDINGQWDFGFDFMYREGNDADKMLFAGRLPSLLILLILGIYVFKWAREAFGPGAALLSLFLYSFSPTFLAHGRFITTDVAAAAGIFISSYYFIRWLKDPGTKNLIIAGLVFGLAQLAKFSCFLLVPLFIFVAFIWIILESKRDSDGSGWVRAFWDNAWKYGGGTILLMVIGYVVVVWPVYLYHVWNYPVDRQQRDAAAILASFGIRPLADLIVWMAGVPILRALAQYGLGLGMVLQRAAGGNTIYFLGQVSAAGWREYFPFVYLVKETLTLHILTIIALALYIYKFFRQKLYSANKIWGYLEQNIDGLLMISFIVLYWFSSIRSPLNIGVRHVLPTFPFIFLLISNQIARWLRIDFSTDSRISLIQRIRQVMREAGWLIIKYIFIFLLILWQLLSVVGVYPSFLAYFNELVDSKNGYLYVADSNLDWGQDLKRLAEWTDKNNIDKIYVEYFGGAMADYYLGEKFQPWWGMRPASDLRAKGGWLAVSATLLQGGRGKPVPGYNDPTGYYSWLDNFQPQAVIGHSIFVYYIPPHAT